MATVTVPGVGTFTVDDAIKSMSPEQQAAEVESMVGQYHAHVASQPRAQASEPSPGEVTENGITPGQGSDGISKAGSALYSMLPGALQRGLNYAAGGIANTAGMLGASDVASGIRSHLDASAMAAPSTTRDLATSLGSGQVLRAASDIPGALLEGLPSMVPAIGAAALAPEAIPAGVAAAAGGALGGIATQAGDLAAARAAHNGNATPSLGDKAVGVLAGAGLGALSGVGLEAGGTLPARLLANAAADAGQNAGQQLATTAGTRDGAQVDPASLASSALLGAAGRAGMAGGGALRGMMSPEAQAVALAGRWADMSPAEQVRASAQSGAATALQQAMQDAPGATPAQAARTAAANLATGVNGLTNRLVQQGALDRDGAGVIGAALQAARSPGKALTGDYLGAVAGLGLDAPTTAALSTGLLHLDALSSPDALATSGPLQSIGGATGHALGHVVGLGPVGGAITSRIGGAVGGGLGSVGDAALGLGSPALLRDGARASAMMGAAGEAAPAPAGDQLAAATATARDVLAQQRALIAQQQAADAAAAQRFGLEYSDARAMNAQFNAQQNGQRAFQVQDATALNRQMQAAQARASAAPVLAGAGAASPADGMAMGDSGNTLVGSTPVPGAAQPGQSSGPPTGLLESPADLPGPLGAATNRAQALAAMKAMAPASGEAQGAPNALMQALGEPGTYSPDLGGLPPAALAQAARLPDWMFALGSNLENALHVSGQARPVNTHAEVLDALGSLQDMGLPADLAQGLATHQGRVVPLLFNLLRNTMLKKYGIDRTVPSGTGQPAAPSAQPLPTSQTLATR